MHDVRSVRRTKPDNMPQSKLDTEAPSAQKSSNIISHNPVKQHALAAYSQNQCDWIPLHTVYLLGNQYHSLEILNLRFHGNRVASANNWAVAK